MNPRKQKNEFGAEVPDLLVLDLLNGDLILEDGWDDLRASEETTATSRERILALLTALRDITEDVNGRLPVDYPRELDGGSLPARSLGALMERELAVMQAEAEGKAPPLNWPRPPRRSPPPGMGGDATCWGEANAILADYPMTRQIHLVVTSEDQDTEAWKVEERSDGSRPKLEFRMVNEVLRLAQTSQLHRLRTCECGKWFFAKRSKQSSHAPQCRKKKYAHTEKVKAHRREYMRWYYAMYQSPKAPRKKLTFLQWSKKLKN